MSTSAHTSIPGGTASLGRPESGLARPELPRRPRPFRLLFPLGQLLLCALLLLPFRNVILFELFGLRGVYSFAPDSGTTIGPDGTVQFRTNPAFERWLRVEDMAFKAVSFLNLPGGLVQLAPAIFRADHDEWIPEHVETRIWNAVTWPISALPFWWIIGRGVEALHAARKRVIAPRLRWFESMISFLLLAGGATLAVGFLFFAGEDPGDWMTVVACGLWALLGGMSVLARYLQWRIKKEL